MPITRSTLPNLPDETQQEARKVYNIQHIYLRIGDQLETLLAEVDARLLSPAGALPGSTALRLALVTAFQYAEMLPDALAAEATLKRMDWKYALRLPVRHPGISAEALGDFRRTLFSFPSALREFGRLLQALAPTGLFSKSQSLDALQVLDAVCQCARLHWLNQSMRAALSALAAEAPEWLGENAQPHWYARYHAPEAQAGIVAMSFGDAQQHAQALGADACCLLSAARQRPTPSINQLSEMTDLQNLCEKQFVQDENGFHWRLPGCLGCPRNQYPHQPDRPAEWTLS